MSKILYKSIFATLLKKKFQLGAMGFIIMLSSFVYSIMFYSVSSLENPTYSFLEEYNQEDFAIEISQGLTSEEFVRLDSESNIPENIFTLFQLRDYDTALFDEIIDTRKALIASVYPNLILEEREYKDFYFQFQESEHRGFAIRNSSLINLSYIEEGQMPNSNGKIAITRIYAQKNNISLGDDFLINNKSFLVTGFVLFPDYTFPMFDNSFLIDTAKQTLICVVDEDFESLVGSYEIRFSGIINNFSSNSDFTKEVIDTFHEHDSLEFVQNIVLTENQFRSGAIFDELRGGKAFSLGFSIIISSIALIIISLMVHKIMDNERGQIGVLKSLGYTSFQIASPYLVAIGSYSLPVLVLGYYLGFLFSPYMRDMYLEFYLLPSVEISQDIFVFLTAVFVPMMFFTILASIIIYRMLSLKPLDLLSVKRQDSVNWITKLAHRFLTNVKPKTRFKYLYVLKNSWKFIIFFIGIALSTILILISFMMNGIIERMSTQTYDRVMYEYESYLDPTQALPDLKDNQEMFLSFPDTMINNINVMSTGLSPEGELFKLFDNNQEDITYELENGLVITKTLNIKYDIDVGDYVDLSVGNTTNSFIVSGVAEDFTGDKVYIDIQVLSKMLLDTDSFVFFNGVYSLSRPDSDAFEVIISKEAIIDQARLMEQFMQFTVWILISISFIVSVLILFVLTSMTVEDNYYNISLLKVMGYSKGEVNKMILGSYFAYTIISYLISVPIALAFLNIIMKFFAKEYDMVIPLQFRWFHFFFALALIILIFVLGTVNAKRKINNISLQEVLKAYRE